MARKQKKFAHPLVSSRNNCTQENVSRSALKTFQLSGKMLRIDFRVIPLQQTSLLI